jgi:hypothetical protein
VAGCCVHVIYSLIHGQLAGSVDHGIESLIQVLLRSAECTLLSVWFSDLWSSDVSTVLTV